MIICLSACADDGDRWGAFGPTYLLLRMWLVPRSSSGS